MESRSGANSRVGTGAWHPADANEISSALSGAQQASGPLWAGFVVIGGRIILPTGVGRTGLDCGYSKVNLQAMASFTAGANLARILSPARAGSLNRCFALSQPVNPTGRR